MTLGIVEVDALVNLPQIQVVGPQAPERLVELPHCDNRVASVRADLGHQEDRVPAIGDGTAHSPLALALVILLGVVEKVDSGVERFMNDSYRLDDRLRLAEVVAAEADDRHLIGVASKRPAINRFAFGGLRHLSIYKMSRQGTRCE